MGCTASEPQAVTRLAPAERDYRGIETRLLEGDLVQFVVKMGDASTHEDVQDYAKCAAAQYALIRGYGFARHVRTHVEKDENTIKGDAVYTISPSLPRGIRTIDAEVVASYCEANGIPMV